jgi:hypothetical protein
MARFGINSSAQKQGQLAGCFVNGNKHSGFMKFVEVLQ